MQNHGAVNAPFYIGQFTQETMTFCSKPNIGVTIGFSGET